MRLVALLLLLPTLAHAQLMLLRGGSSAGSGPLPNSVAAAIATANNNALCINLYPFYWEIGTVASGATPLVAQSVGFSALYAGTPGHNVQNSIIPLGTQMTVSTNVTLASASKWVYGAYVVQRRGGISSLTTGNTGDIGFLHFASGYDQMGNASVCPYPTYTTINNCLASNALYSQQNAPDIGVFHYDTGHEQNHASQNFSTLANTPDTQLAAAIWTTFGIGQPMVYSSPVPAIGLYGNGLEYRNFLQNILNGTLLIGQNLNANTICTNYSGNSGNGYPDEPSPGVAGNYAAYGSYAAQTVNGVSPGPNPCPSTGSPFPENLQYSMGHWVETDPVTNGDGAYSSGGAYGTYPWIDKTLTYYGLLVRAQPPGTYTNGIFVYQQGYASLLCGRLIRRAFITGIQQTGTIPTP